MSLPAMALVLLMQVMTVQWADTILLTDLELLRQAVLEAQTVLNYRLSHAPLYGEQSPDPEEEPFTVIPVISDVIAADTGVCLCLDRGPLNSVGNQGVE